MNIGKATTATVSYDDDFTWDVGGGNSYLGDFELTNARIHDTTSNHVDSERDRCHQTVEGLMRHERVRRAVTTREITLIAAGVYLIAVLAWLALIYRWIPMPGMGEGMPAMGESMSMADPGVPETMATESVPMGWMLYLAMWSVMMVAMMYPSSVPLVRLYHRTLDGISAWAKVARIGVFLGAYTLVWASAGIVPLVVNHVAPITEIASSEALFAGTLLLLGTYQLSPYKDRCLEHCRTPLGFLMTHHRSGARGAVRMGFDHSVFCLGCCWALFAFMVVVGTMNLVWMAVITVVLSFERTVSWGETLARGVGVLASVIGIGLLVWIVEQVM